MLFGCTTRRVTPGYRSTGSLNSSSNPQKITSKSSCRPLLRRPNARNEDVKCNAESGAFSVYEDNSSRLEEGVRKHILSVFVADESGMINRVAGVFARRGSNIESLAVGLSEDKALFTIIATGTDSVVSNLSKQLAKLVNVKYVEDITENNHIEREMILLKLSSPPGEIRTEISNLTNIFRGRIVDVGETSCTILLTGDVGKIESFVRATSKFGIVELNRTGRIAINRGRRICGEEVLQNIDALDAARTIKVADQSIDGIYGNNFAEAPKNILGATYHKSLKIETRILCINVVDEPGVLNEVTGVIARRGYNLQSLAVGNSEVPGMSRITLVIPVGKNSSEKLIKQLLKLISVHSIFELHNVPHVQRELMLIKVSCTPDNRGEIFDIARIFRGNICDLGRDTAILEISGKEEKLGALQDILEPYGILEVARTGLLACRRESGVDSSYLKGIKGSRV